MGARNIVGTVAWPASVREDGRCRSRDDIGARDGKIRRIRRISRCLLAPLALVCCAGLLPEPTSVAAAGGVEAPGMPSCAPFVLPVASIIEAPSQYRDYCTRCPAQCELSGPPLLALAPPTWQIVVEVNRAVNAEIAFVPDPEEFGFEDYWTLPQEGWGDCEDFALEKRRRLAEAGLPAAAMRLAVVQHRLLLFSHAVLTVDTDRGGIVLDDRHDEILCWNDAPFNYEMRENIDGTWSRFDRSEWPVYKPPELPSD